MNDDQTTPVTVSALRAELVGWPDDAPLTITVPDRAQSSIAAILPIVGAGYGPGVEASDDPVLAISFPLIAAHHAEAAQDVDPWGVPDRMLGPIPDGFYGAVGRVVTLSALLEDRLRALLQAVRHAPQTAHAKDAPGRFIPELRRQAAKLGPDWARLAGYLDDVDAALERRNVLVHNLWQSKDGHFYGHRLDRTPKRASATTTLDELHADIAELVRLIDGWQPWFALAGSIPWRQGDT